MFLSFFVFFFVAAEKEILNVLFIIIFNGNEKCDQFFSIWSVYKRKEEERKRSEREKGSGWVGRDAVREEGRGRREKTFSLSLFRSPSFALSLSLFRSLALPLSLSLFALSLSAAVGNGRPSATATVAALLLVSQARRVCAESFAFRFSC